MLPTSYPPEGSFWDSPHRALYPTVTCVQPEEPDSSELRFLTRQWQCLCAHPCPGRREQGEHQCGVESCWAGSPQSLLQRPKASLDAATTKPNLQTGHFQPRPCTTHRPVRGGGDSPSRGVRGRSAAQTWVPTPGRSSPRPGPRPPARLSAPSQPA